MGCSSDKPSTPENRIIQSDMASHKVKRFDEFFKDVGLALAALEKIRKGVCETIHQMQEHTDVDGLIPWGGFLDALKVFFTSVSSHNGGSVMAAAPKISTTAPHFSMDESKMHGDCLNFYKHLKDHFEALESAPADLVTLSGKMLGVAKDVPGLLLNAYKECKEANLDPFSALKEIKALKDNGSRLTTGIGKCSTVKKTCTEALSGLKSLVNEFKTHAEVIDNMGKQAKAKNLTDPIQIFWELYPGTKLAGGHDALVADRLLPPSKRAGNPKKKKDKNAPPEPESPSKIQADKIENAIKNGTPLPPDLPPAPAPAPVEAPKVEAPKVDAPKA